MNGDGNLWSRWPQRENFADESSDKHWFAKSFAAQMAEISGELGRVLRNPDKLNRIRTDSNYIGEPQTIQRVFEIIKRDPKNAELLQEVERVERETFSFLCGTPQAPSLEHMRGYWNKWFETWMDELEQNDESEKQEEAT